MFPRTALSPNAGLLPLLKAAISDIQIAIFANQVVAVDAYSWLHKGAYSCARDLVEGRHNTGYDAWNASLSLLILDKLLV